MIISFLKYINPIWYYNLKPSVDYNYFPLQNEILKNCPELQVDEQYISEEARNRDLSYRAHKLGYISSDRNSQGIQVWNSVDIPATDEYRFIRKNYNAFWVYYILIYRILSFKNPFIELKGLRNSSKGIEKISYRDIKNSINEDYEAFQLKSHPLVSVIIPTLNRYDYLINILKDLENQDYKNFEVLVIDQSDPFKSDFYGSFNLNIQVIHQEEPALWLARNTGTKKAKGELIAFSEDDVRIDKNWISEHVKCIQYWNADISSGIFFPEGASIPKEKSYFKFADQFATGNACLFKKAFEMTGLFDRNFERQRMGDGEFGCRAYLSGLLSISNPLAYCLDVKAPKGGLRQMGSWDAYRPKSFFGDRPIPSVLYYQRKYFGNSAAIRSLIKNIPPSVIPYKLKGNTPLMLFSYLISFILLPVFAFPVYKSWNKASKMLKRGFFDE